MKNQSFDDNHLVKTIYDRIKWDIRVNNSDIMVAAHDGDIVLSGYFDKAYRHCAAVEIIRSTEGVKNLKDQSLVVADYYRTDKELKVLIEKQLKSFHLMPGEWIEVDVADGVVKLEGCVFRPRLKAFAASDSWGLSGIKDCINLIEIKTPPTERRRQSINSKGLYHINMDEAYMAAEAD